MHRTKIFNICDTKLKFMHTPYIYVHASAKKHTVVCQSSIYIVSIHLIPVHVHVFLLKYHTLFSWHIHKMSWGYTCEPAEENRTEPPFHWLSLFLLHPQTSWPLLTFYPRLCLSPIKIQMPTLYLISMKSGQLFSGNRDFLEYVFLRKMSLLLNTKVVYFRCNQFPKLNKNSSTTHWCVNYGHTLNSYLRSLKARTVST